MEKKLQGHGKSSFTETLVQEPGKLFFKNTIFAIFILASVLGCSKSKDFTGTGPEIEWEQGGTTISYSYSGGVVSGYTFRRAFLVKSESGEITIAVSVSDNEESLVSETFPVEVGKKYEYTVKAVRDGKRASNMGESCLKVVLSSPNCRSDFEIPVDSYLVPSYNEWVQDNYYCPVSFIFSDATIKVVD